MERRYELETLRRSLMMLAPGVPTLSREEAMALLDGLAETQQRLDRLCAGLRELLGHSPAAERAV